MARNKRKREVCVSSADGEQNAEPLKTSIDRRLFRGFKSYRDQILVGPFDSGFTCIVGANGSGKSSIVEALCFVFGFKATTLRGSNVEQLRNETLVIENRDALCEVTAEFKFGSDMLKITRRVSKSQNEYFIATSQKQSTRISKGQLWEMLSKEYGLKLSCSDRFVVHQNKIVNLMQRGPESLLEFIEGIIGTLPIKDAIERNQKESLEAKVEMEKLMEKLTSIESSISTLLPHVRQWERYESELSNFNHNKEKLLYKTRVLLQVEHGKLSSDSAAQQKSFEESSSRRNELRQRYNELETEVSNTTDVIDKKQSNISEVEKEKQDITTNKLKLQVRITATKKSLDKVQKQLENLQSKQKAAKSSPISKQQLIQQQIDEHKEKLENLKNAKDELQSKLQQSEQELNSVNHQIHNLNSESTSLKNQICVYEQKIMETSQQLHKAQSYKNTSEIEAAVNQLRSNTAGVYGFPRDIATVDKKYQVAVNSALGNELHTVIVENRSHASIVIDYFKKHALGVISCEILSEVKECQDTSNISDDSLIPLTSLIKCGKYYPIFTKKLKNWYCVRDVAIAARLSQRNQRISIVTETGEIFKSWGEVSSNKSSKTKSLFWIGTSLPEASASAASGNKIDESKLSHQLDVLKQEANSLHTQLQSKERELVDLKKKKLQLESTIQDYHKQIQDIVSTSKSLVATIERLEHKMASSQNDYDEGSRQTAAQRQRTDEKLNQRIAQTAAGVKELSEQLESYEKEIKSHNSALRKCDKRIKSFQRELDAIKQKREETQSELKSVSEQIHSIDDKVRKLEDAIRSTRKRLCEIQNELDVLPNNIGMTDEIHQWQQECINDFERSKKQLKRLKVALDMEEQQLKEAKATLNIQSLEQFMQLQQQLQDTTEQKEHALAKSKTLDKEREALESRRFSMFIEAITAINKQLSQIFQELTITGDCYLSYSEHKTALFQEGVTFHVKPDRTWKNFAGLSGGQKACADADPRHITCTNFRLTLQALALALSFQALYPSPLYLFDEIDANLDTKATERVARYINKVSKCSQFVVVSLRPQLYELCNCLIGVYFFSQSSNTVVLNLDNKQAANDTQLLQHS